MVETKVMVGGFFINNSIYNKAEMRVTWIVIVVVEIKRSRQFTQEILRRRILLIICPGRVRGKE